MVRPCARTKRLRAREKNRRARTRDAHRGEPADHALGRSRGGFGTKLHLVTDGTGLPLAIALSAGQAHESQYAAPLLARVRIHRATPGRPRSRPDAVAGDKGYSYPRIRQWLEQHHVHAVIPERSDQRERHAHRPGRKAIFDQALYRRRNVIERCVGWLKEARGIATRYEKLALHYLAFLKLGMIRKLVARMLTPLSHTA